MTQPCRFWADLTTAEMARLDPLRTIAVLPVAATEQHGPHLPLSVDTDLVNGMVQASLPHLPADLPVLFLPTQTVGYSPEHARFAGTLTLKPETIVRLWTDLGESVAASGVRKLLFFNSHGGQVSVMDMVARDLRARLDMLVYSCSWFNLPLQDAQGHDLRQRFSPDEHRFGVHAGQTETALMLALRPERVQMQHAQDFASTSRDRAARFAVLGNGSSAKMAWQMQDYNPQGAAGQAVKATADDGKALLDAAGRALARLIAEIDALPADTLKSSSAYGPPA